jgi:hypothetical protein
MRIILEMILLILTACIALPIMWLASLFGR